MARHYKASGEPVLYFLFLASYSHKIVISFHHHRSDAVADKGIVGMDGDNPMSRVANISGFSLVEESQFP